MIIIIDSSNVREDELTDLQERAIAVINEADKTVVKDRELRCKVESGILHFVLQNVHM